MVWKVLLALVLILSAPGVARAQAQAGGLPALAERVSALEAANSSLKSALAAEVAARQAADTALQSALNAEAATRTAADTGLKNAIDSEVAARVAADEAEMGNRQAADQALWTEINNSSTKLWSAINNAPKPKVWSNYVNGVGVGNYDRTILDVSPREAGRYVVNAKVSMYNLDGDYQTGNCKLWVLRGAHDPLLIDVTQVRVGAQDDADQVSIALQADYETWEIVWDIYLTCGTYHGNVWDAALTAIQIPD